MGGIPVGTIFRGGQDAERLQKEMEGLFRESSKTSARLAGLAAGKVTQTRARPVSGGLAGGQAQRTGGIQGGQIGGPLGKRGPASPSTTAGE